MLSFHVKFAQTDGQVDRRTERLTMEKLKMAKQYAPGLSMLGHRNAGHQHFIF